MNREKGIPDTIGPNDSWKGSMHQRHRPTRTSTHSKLHPDVREHPKPSPTIQYKLTGIGEGEEEKPRKRDGGQKAAENRGDEKLVH